MKQFLISLAILSVGYSSRAQNIPAYSAKDIIAHCSSRDTIYIINFWATWCPPCVQELPEFNALQKRYAGKPVKVLLVSLDFKETYPIKLATFVERKRLTPQVAWLSDTNPNEFIPLIEESWGGSIPATVLVAPGKNFKKFIEGSVTEKQVGSIVNGLLSQ